MLRTAPRPRPLLEIAGLRVLRDDATILDGVNWKMERGQNWVVLGPNGCGKTSLLRVLMGYLTPTAGQIRVLGRTYGASDWRELRRRIGLVSSALQASIPPGETALRTVVSGARAQLDLWGEPTATEARAARRHLAALDALHLAGRPWTVLSQGERQRVLVARALAARPRLLILDEPCAGLDPVAREEFLLGLDALARARGAPPLVMVTHHVEEITPAFTHALLLRAGRILAAGKRDTVLTSAHLGELYDRTAHLRRRNGRFELRLSTHPRFLHLP